MYLPEVPSKSNMIMKEAHKMEQDDNRANDNHFTLSYFQLSLLGLNGAVVKAAAELQTLVNHNVLSKTLHTDEMHKRIDVAMQSLIGMRTLLKEQTEGGPHASEG